MKMKQIAIEPAAGDRPAIMWAVCKDGSLWMRELRASEPWLRMPAPKDPVPRGPKETDMTPPLREIERVLRSNGQGESAAN